MVKPYNQTPYINKGKELASLTEKIPANDFAGDIEKINKWAEYLNINNWFSWIDFEKIPADYEEMI